MAVLDRLGTELLGPDWQSWMVSVWLGRARSGAARPGLAVKAGSGQALQGTVSLVMAVLDRQRRPRLAAAIHG